MRFFLLVPLLAYTAAYDECYKHGDGAYSHNCRTYILCHNNHGTLHYCPNPPATDTVFDARTGRCDNPNNVPPPCGMWQDCSVLGDRRYADISTNCTSYYTCHKGTYFGHNFCDKGVVFDETMQLCNWPQNVAPPCGTWGIGRR
uniref:Uncharacterized protein LOC111127283 n=1 Tax=Crassostrea virginica TaxID=6565 RepID=A0A8B8DKG7_CRAVI|nr:uncharacterized protein LOC111127283 [Crassostrea virginica]